MPRRTLTDRFCIHAKAAEGEAQTDYFDEGRAGLALRVSRAGSKSRTYHFTLGGRRVRMTLPWRWALPTRNVTQASVTKPCNATPR